MTHINVKVLRVDLNKPDDGVISAGAAVLKDAKPLVFPTDTVYGIGMAVGQNLDANKIFDIKKREYSQTLPWLVNSIEMLDFFGEDVCESCKNLARDYWPGALTIVVRASNNVPDIYRASDNTIALRMPDSIVSLKLIEAVDSPIATTSANIHGRMAVSSFEELDKELLDQVDLALDGGKIPLGVPSTIVSYADGSPKILRAGAIDEKIISDYL